MFVEDTPTRTIWWAGDAVAVIDQRRLPHDLVIAYWRTVDDVADGIAEMTVRGAPLIGVAAAYGIALAAAADSSDAGVTAAMDRLVATRPTAVNLRWALDRVVSALLRTDPVRRADRAREMADQMADDDVLACRMIGDHGVELIRAVHDRNERQVQILTHCNAGRLATVEWGTATAPIYLADRAGVPLHVWVSETRPRNQGAALTAWELGAAGIDHTVIVDNAAGHLFAQAMVDLVIVGADRVAANGDAANKIGTSLKAYAAAVFGVPFYVAAPWSTIDMEMPSGESIPIEERSPLEVLTFGGVPIAPAATPARNWGFDVTPARFITSLITDRGIVGADAESIRVAATAATEARRPGELG